MACTTDWAWPGRGATWRAPRVLETERAAGAGTATTGTDRGPETTWTGPGPTTRPEGPTTTVPGIGPPTTSGPRMEALAPKAKATKTTTTAN